MANRSPYEVLKLNEDADFAQIEEAYKKLKAQYSEDRFKAGEEGNQGARNLMELEESFDELKTKNMRCTAVAFFGNDLGDIDSLIRLGKYDDAQGRLDAINERTAEWHYLQSIVFYRREWLSESKKQLTMAIAKDPDNQKYRLAMMKMETVMGNPRIEPEQMGRQQQGPYGGRGDFGQGAFGRQGGPADSLCDCCMATACMSCCCNCMPMCGRGD